MSYQKNSWSDGDIITAGKLNNIENGVESVETNVTQATSDISTLQNRVTALEESPSTPADYQELVDDVSSLKADLTQLDESVTGEKTTIPFVQTGTGYIRSSPNDGTPILSYTDGATGNNQAMVINDFTTYGLSVGDTLRVVVGWASGFEYCVGFSDTQITGTVALLSAIQYMSEQSVQTIEFKIPNGATALIICNRKPAFDSPTITKISGGLANEVEKLGADLISAESNLVKLSAIKYRTCVNKPFNFSNKNLSFFGDSITYGYIAASGNIPAHQATNQYPKLFAQGVGANYSNYGVSGSTLAVVSGYGSISTRIEKTALTNADAVFIAGGINDWRLGVDEATLKTAVTGICEYLKNNFNGEVIFITPINEAGKTPMQTPTQTLQNVRNVITRIALKYGYSVVQGWEFPFPKEDDDSDYISLMLQDKVHPTELGYSMYAQALRNALC